MLSKACEGPCLAYHGCAGWSVVNGRQLGRGGRGDDLRRTRVLGVQGRPEVVLYEEDGQYVARLVTVPLQVAGRSPKECFSDLREACRRYEARYGARWITDGRPPVLVRVDHRDDSELLLDGRIQMLAKRGKFWANGAEIAATVWAPHHRG